MILSSNNHHHNSSGSNNNSSHNNRRRNVRRSSMSNSGNKNDHHRSKPPLGNTHHHVTDQQSCCSTGSTSTFNSQSHHMPQHRELVLDADSGSINGVYSGRQSNFNKVESSVGSSSIFDNLVSAVTYAPTQTFVQESSPPTSRMSRSAAMFGKGSPRCGYLCKLTREREYLRQFFVLKPSTHLYMFASPSDEHPIGCMDLDCDGSVTCNVIENCEDGRCRFEVIVYGDTNKGHAQKNKLILEARNKEVAEEWMNSLESERLSYAKAQVRDCLDENKVFRNTIQQLENQINDFKLIEKERDDALKEVEGIRSKLGKINEAIILLTKQLRQPPPTSSIKDMEHRTDSPTRGKCAQNQLSPSRYSNYSEDDRRFELLKNELHDTELATLSNACNMVQDNLRVTAIEANSAIEEVQQANANTAKVTKRMGKAEKLLTKLWEDNCTLREQLRQTKQERKVLLSKVRSLTEPQSSVQKDLLVPSTRGVDQVQDVTPKLLSNKEQTLLRELEDHIAISMKLHKKFLDQSGTVDVDVKQVMDPVQISKNPQNEENSPTDYSNAEEENTTSSEQNNTSVSNSFKPPSDVSESAEKSNAARTDLSPLKPRNILSELDRSTDIDYGLPEQRDKINKSLQHEDTLQSKEEPPLANVPNPVSILDNIDDDGDDGESCGQVMSSSSSISSVTDNWKATSRIGLNLDCEGSISSVGQIYHISFYSNKIGIQFQKVPASSFVRGVLSDAVSDVDVGFSHGAQYSTIETLHAASPIDAVLVCGVRGFDRQRNVPPKLGARLIGFDNISIEKGSWTFESVRNAIRNRGRPITMSFRNDVLSNYQKSILEQAMDVNIGGKNLPTYSPRSRSGFSSQSNIDQTPNASNSSRPPIISRLSYSDRSHESRHISTDYMMKRGDKKSNPPVGYPFSETGSSILSATFAPLVSGLMNGLDQTHENYIDSELPYYLRSSQRPRDSSPDEELNKFTNELL